LNKELVKLVSLGLVLVVAAFWLAGRFVPPAPPRAFTLAAGSEGGAYLAVARQYAALLAEQGIAVEVLETRGSVENVELLARGEADVALVQTGVPVPAESGIEGLGALYYEPLWIFARDEQPLRPLTALAGQRVAVGEVGSGTRAAALALLAEHGVDEEGATLAPLQGEAALAALVEGRVDAVMLVGAMTSPQVQAFLDAPGVDPAPLEMAEALARRLPFLTVIEVPRGLLDVVEDKPAESMQLLSPVASLVARAEFHPALVDLLLVAAAQVHGAGDLLTPAGMFPAAHPTAAPLSAEAQRHFTDGLPFLKRVLPFWAATLVSRMWVMVIPLLTILVPLFKVIPPTYHWRLRSQIFRLYRRLRAVDARRLGGGAMDRTALLEQVTAIEAETETLKVPISYYDRVYQLKMHTAFVRRQLEAGDTDGEAVEG
jgi:uncharacterized protein